MPSSRPWLLVVALIATPAPAVAQAARIHESTQMILTYPFSEPDRVPILVKDSRLYPYNVFTGYAHEGTMQPWKVVTLENELIAVEILPQVGGKVWGATVKKTGHEFIYKNKVLKFRNIALRGPWTSGGIEFNFGVIGHTPSTATPVDYILRTNDDGSVSCIVGMMDLPSRTEWRVEIRLEPGRAAFETNVRWSNPTTFEQPYYNWMTGAAPAAPDLRMTIPGNASLGHPGNVGPWPTDADQRDLSNYRENNFGGNKSYHVVGELADYFGGYYTEADRGFGHWAPAVDMPGQKLWLWSLARDGGIWEELLTDTDGQYVEYQAGRMLVQYTPSTAVTPIRDVGFEPGRTDSWSESWFPLEGTGGLTAASRRGAMFAHHEGGKLRVSITAFEAITDTLTVRGPRTGNLLRVPVTLAPLEVVSHDVDYADNDYTVLLPAFGIRYAANPQGRSLSRPWQTDSAARATLPVADRLADSARQLMLARRYPEARSAYATALDGSPWHRPALLGMAELERRRGLYREGLALATRALQLDAYDPATNFVAAHLYRATNRLADATLAYGFAERSMQYRVPANIALAEMALARRDHEVVRRHADRALAADRDNLPARELLAIVARRERDSASAERLRLEMLTIDPLHHFVAAERALDTGILDGFRALRDGLGGEYPEQVMLELAIGYDRRGARDDAAAILRFTPGAVATAWRAQLTNDSVARHSPADIALAFPYRPETLSPLSRMTQYGTAHWTWGYLSALNLWALDRADEAARVMADIEGIDNASALATRALLLEREYGINPVPDLRRAVAMDPADRMLRVRLVEQLAARGEWDTAVEVTAEALRHFRGDFTLELLQVAALLELNRADAAIRVLDQIRVLPSEHSRGSHRLWEQAHSMAALDALERRRYETARDHLARALTWPEHLGQGKPYEPDERLTRYLQAVLAARSNAGTPLTMSPPFLTNTIDVRLVQRARELSP